MEAIGEIIAAILGAIVELFVTVTTLVASMAAMVLEALFLLVTQGRTAATEQWKESKSKLAERRAAHAAGGQPSPQQQRGDHVVAG